MNPHPPSDRTPGPVATVPSAGGWPRSLVASAVFLTLAQVVMFIWLARIPGPFVDPTPPSSRAASRSAPIILAVNGLREAQGWLPNPRGIYSPAPGSVTPGLSTRAVRIDVETSGIARPPEYLPLEAAPAPVSPVIQRPPFRPSDLEAPRPFAPVTGPLALAHAEITISGPLQSRPVLRPITPMSWQGPEPLGVTRVEISVNADGEVVLARVLESCGVKAADLQFLAACRAARFVPAGRVRPGQEFSGLVRARVTHRWPAPL